MLALDQGVVVPTMVVNVIVFWLAFKILTEADVTWRDVLPGEARRSEAARHCRGR